MWFENSIGAHHFIENKHKHSKLGFMLTKW